MKESRFIIPNTLKVTRITSQILERNQILQLQFLTQLSLTTEPITDRTGMSNVFNNYFTSIAILHFYTKSNIKFLPEHYTNYLSNTNTNTFFLTPTDKMKYLL